MKTIMVIALLAGVFAWGASAAQKASRQAALDSLVAAERAFAAAAKARGTREAFLANLADDAILFRPRPVPGKKWLMENPAPPALLTWEPAFSDVSAAGDMGYNTGPWEVRKNDPDDQPAAFGQFVTVWKKQADGQWKAVIDDGIAHGPHPAAAPWAAARPGAPVKGKTDLVTERTALLQADRELARALSEKGADALLSHLTDDARVLRHQRYPLLGKEAARAYLAEEKSGVIISTPAFADVAHSGDLGYTYGATEYKPAGDGNHIRIWRKQRDGGWKVVLDLSSLAPPQPAAQ